MNKKGDVTINTVIVAVLAIIVLVVLAGIFTGRIKWFEKGTVETTSQFCGAVGKGGACLEECPDGSKQLTAPLGGWKDCSEAQKCCKAEAIK